MTGEPTPSDTTTGRSNIGTIAIVALMALGSLLTGFLGLGIPAMIGVGLGILSLGTLGMGVANSDKVKEVWNSLTGGGPAVPPENTVGMGEVALAGGAFAASYGTLKAGGAALSYATTSLASASAAILGGLKFWENKNAKQMVSGLNELDARRQKNKHYQYSADDIDLLNRITNGDSKEAIKARKMVAKNKTLSAYLGDDIKHVINEFATDAAKAQLDADTAKAHAMADAEARLQAEKYGATQTVTTSDGLVDTTNGRPMDVDELAHQANQQANAADLDAERAQINRRVNGEQGVDLTQERTAQSQPKAPRPAEPIDVSLTPEAVKQELLAGTGDTPEAPPSAPRSNSATNTQQMDSPRMASAKASTPTGFAVPRASRGAALGGGLSGINRLGSNDLGEQLLGGADLAEGAIEGIAAVSKSAKFLTAAPIATAIVAPLNLPYDIKHTVQSAKSGDVVETAAGAGYSALDVAMTADATHRIAQTGRLGAGAARLAGAGTSLASKAFLPLAAALGAINIFKFSDQTVRLTQEAHAAISQDITLHQEGVSAHLYNAEKIEQMVVNSQVAEAPLDRPSLSDYKQIPKALTIVTKYVDVSPEELEAATPRQLTDYITQAKLQVSQAKDASIASLSDSQFRARNAVQLMNPANLAGTIAHMFMPSSKALVTDQDLAKSSVGRLMLNMENHAAHALVGSPNADKQKSIESVDNIDSDLRTLNAAQYELHGEKKDGTIRGDKWLLSYEARMKHYHHTQDVRSAIANEITPQSLAKLSEEISNAQAYNEQYRNDKPTQEAYASRIKEDSSIQAMKDDYAKYAFVAQQAPEDEVIAYKAMVALHTLATAEQGLMKEVSGKVFDKRLGIKKEVMQTKDVSLADAVASGPSSGLPAAQSISMQQASVTSAP